MSKIELTNLVDCLDLSSDEINFKVKDLIFNKHKNLILKNTHSENQLLECIKALIKIEIFGDVGSDFANNVSGLKIIVNGNVGDNSACSIEKAKITIFGACSNNFGNNIKSSEVYLLEGCGANSFLKLANNSKVVLGGQVGSNFAAMNNGGTVVLLNLKGGSIFVDESWFKDSTDSHIYIRGDKNKIKLVNDNSSFTLNQVDYNDEDLYLPLISEFSRLFGVSLSEIKSKPFNKALLK